MLSGGLLALAPPLVLPESAAPVAAPAGLRAGVLELVPMPRAAFRPGGESVLGLDMEWARAGPGEKRVRFQLKLGFGGGKQHHSTESKLGNVWLVWVWTWVLTQVKIGFNSGLNPGLIFWVITVEARFYPFQSRRNAAFQPGFSLDLG